jgi:Zn-dependent metalloprotease
VSGGDAQGGWWRDDGSVETPPAFGARAFGIAHAKVEDAVGTRPARKEVPMHECRNPLHCVVPPYVVDQLAQSPNAEIRRRAMELSAEGAAARAVRLTLAGLPRMAAIPSPAAGKHRQVYDLQHQGMNALPGKLARSEGNPASADPAVNEAYNHSGTVYDFYKNVLGRNSLDDNGMALISSVHFRSNHNNAYWNGERMIYGDGDGQIFVRFTKALDVVGHELSHGVVTHTCNLVYQDEPGALNEHFADVFGVLVEQWKKKKPAKTGNWLVGEAIMGPGVNAKALRSFKDEKAYEDDPLLGTDPQPKHYADRYKGSEDYGGVHINSGIPNHAFYLAAQALGGNAWGKAGAIWYKSLYRLKATSSFEDMVRETIGAASDLYGASVANEIKKAWKTVGLY